jgi:hypothetical protein
METAISICVIIVFVASLGFCIARIVMSIFAEARYRAVLSQNASYATITDEPFPGALYLCALLVYIYQTAYDAEHEMRSSFKQVCRADWGPYCRAAESLHTALNGDLLVESLASVLSKKKLTPTMLSLVFKTLTSAELVWNDSDRGTKPSLYLAQLLDYKVEDLQLVEAYRTLGLTPEASLVEVKSAHRKLAAKYHPDSIDAKKTSGSENSEPEVFMKIQNAYEFILSQRA